MNRFPSTPPASIAPKPWDFPESLDRTLVNGIQVAVIRMPALPIVSVRWCFVSGRLHEKPDRLGSGFLLQRLLRHGTEALDSADFARHLDRCGIRLGTQVSVDSTVISVSALREHLGEAVRIASDVVFSPRLPPASLDAERIRAIQMHGQAMSQTEAVSNACLAKTLYGEHPYGRPVTTRSGLVATTTEDVRSLYGQICDPSRALLLVVGDVEPHEVVDTLARVLSERMAPSSTPDLVGPAPPVSAPGVVLVAHPGAEQVSIQLGALAMPRNHPDFLSLRVVNHVLGGGASARLFTELREKQGLTYGVYSQLDCGLWGGDWTASMSVSPAKVDRAVGALAVQMEEMSSGDLGEDELRHAIDYLVGSFPQRASGLAGVSSLSMAAWLHQLSPSVWRDYQSSLRAITREAAAAAAQRWLRPDRLSWVIAGPPDVLTRTEPQLQALGGPVRWVQVESLLE